MYAFMKACAHTHHGLQCDFSPSSGRLLGLPRHTVIQPPAAEPAGHPRAKKPMQFGGGRWAVVFWVLSSRRDFATKLSLGV